MNSDGTGQARITTTANDEDHPSFSPDGSQLAYSETLLAKAQYQAAYNAAANLWTTRLDGTPSVQITTGNFSDWNPSWGKAGIVFSTNRDPASPNWRLWTVNSDGTNLHELYSILSISAVWTTSGNVLFTNENTSTEAISAVSLLDVKSGVVKPVTTVGGYVTSIDFLPTVTPKVVYITSTCTIPVAVFLADSSGNAFSINQQTLRLGHSGIERSLVGCQTNASDPNEGGRPDLLCSFSIPKTKFAFGDAQAILRFSDTSGIPYEGRSTVVTTNVSDPSCP